MDSYDKALRDCLEKANKIWGNHADDSLFKRVHKKDLDEVKSKILFYHPEEEEYEDNWRIYPKFMERQCRAEHRCCGEGYLVINCDSGRSYILGYDYGH